jgi:hypothetical protein
LHRVKNYILIAACSLMQSSAFAQIGSATFTLQASLDNGATWRQGTVDVPVSGEPVLIRAWIEWTFDAGVAFSTCTFDIAIENSGTQDVARDFRRPFPLDQISTQTIVASRFGTTIKIDDSRDTFQPGVGARGVQPRQFHPNFGQPHTTANPLSVFDFVFVPDSTIGARLVKVPFLQGFPPNFDSISCYPTPDGGGNLVRTTLFPLTINVIPSPSTATALLCLPALASRRRR